MLLVVTTTPSRLTSTGGVTPSLEAGGRLVLGAEGLPAVPVRLPRSGLVPCDASDATNPDKDCCGGRCVNRQCTDVPMNMQACTGNQADRLYYRLLVELDRAPDRVLLDDFQRTMMLVEPEVPQPKNLVWKYHWTVSNELEKRSTKAFGRALKLAEDTQ